MSLKEVWLLTYTWDLPKEVREEISELWAVECFGNDCYYYSSTLPNMIERGGLDATVAYIRSQRTYAISDTEQILIHNIW